MKSMVISIIKNKILADILNEVKSFQNYKINHYDDIQIFLDNNSRLSNRNVAIFSYDDTKHIIEALEKINFPLIFLIKKSDIAKKLQNHYKSNIETILVPFTLTSLITKIKLCSSRSEFLKNSIFNILNYKLDLNKREIVNNGKKLKLTEREIYFLIYLKEKKEPSTIQDLLHSVWKYSFKSETHTIETHVHRLRSKFLKIFGEKNVIKNNKKGYYI